MGQDYSDLYPDQQLSQRTEQHLQKRFIICPHPVYSNSQHFKLLHEKLTNNKYILRILATNDESERQKLEDCIYKKIANKCSNLTKLQHYIFEDQKSYCGKRSKCYMVFEINQSITLRQQILKQTTGTSFAEDQIINGMQNLLNGLLWLKYLGVPHGNINTYNIYCRGKKEIVLSDPWIAPQSSECVERYPSPQKLQKICNKIEDYDLYVSDVFSIAMCMLEVIRQVKLDKIYKKNHTINYEQLIEEIGKCPYKQLKQLLEYLLLGSAQNRKTYLQEISRKIGNNRLHSSKSSSQKSNKIKSLGVGIKRMVARQGNVQQKKPIPTFLKKQNKFEYLNKGDPVELAIKPIVDTSMINELKSNGSLSKHLNQYAKSQKSTEMVRVLSQKSTTSVNNPKINFKYIPNQTISFASQDKFTPFRTLPRSVTAHQPLLFTNSSNPSFIPFEARVAEQKRQLVFPPLRLPPMPFLDNLISSSHQDVKVSKSNGFEKLYDKMYGESKWKIESSQFINKYHIDIPHPKQQDQHKKSTFGNPASDINNKNNQAYSVNENKQIIEKPKESYKTKPIVQKRQNYSQISEYMQKIDQNISVFNMAVTEAINKSHYRIKQNKVGSFPVNDNVSHYKIKQKEERFTQFRPSEIMTSNLDNQNTLREKRQKMSLGQEENDSKHDVVSQLVHQQDMELTHSHHNHNEDQQNLKKSQLIMKDSLVEEMKNIHFQKSEDEESKNQYFINKPFLMQDQDGGVVINSFNQPNQANQNNQQNGETPGTPYKMRGTQLELLNNLTIPEETPSDEQSFQGQRKICKGQFCEQIYQSTGKYTGYIYNEKRNGQGTFVYYDGGHYIGNWKDNMMTGEGKLYYENGIVAYDGQWYKDQFHGRGKVYNDNYQQLTQPFDYRTFQDMLRYWTFYDGELAHDMKEGHGKMMLSNGQYYIGEFKEDIPNGKGAFYAGETIIYGVWSYGILISQT